MRGLRLKAWFVKRGVLAFLACTLLFVSAATMADQALSVTPQTIEQLKAIEPKLKFGPDPKTYYTGVFDPLDRLAADKAFEHLIDVLITELPKKPSKTFVLEQFQLTLASLPLSDTEDRERAASYCENIMDVLRIKSSDGVLNRWLYGPVLGRMIGSKK